MLEKNEQEIIDFIESQFKDLSNIDYARIKYAIAMAWGEWGYVKFWQEQIEREEKKLSLPVL